MSKRAIAAETVAGEPVWDTEEPHELMPREAHIRDTTLYVTMALLAWMQQVWGGVLAFVKTSTDAATGEVLIARASEGEPGALPLHRYGSQNVAAFSFWRPLRKLNLKVPSDRQFNVRPSLRKINDNLTVFVLPMAERMSVPRDVNSEQVPQPGSSPETTAGS